MQKILRVNKHNFNYILEISIHHLGLALIFQANLRQQRNKTGWSINRNWQTDVQLWNKWTYFRKDTNWSSFD